jgi:hypothetical protein
LFEWQRSKDRVIRAEVLVFLDICIQIPNVEKEGGALAVVQVGEQSVLDEPA